MTEILTVVCVTLVVGLIAAILYQRGQNKSLTLKLVNMQLELTTKDLHLRSELTEKTAALKTAVEQRLVDHTKYCEKVEGMIKDLFAVEEKKWRELVDRIKTQFYTALDAAKNETGAAQDEIMAKVKKDLETQIDKFRGLMDQAYLEEYEKMRRNPPRPTSRPRTKGKVQPPERFRSLDDDFNCGVMPEPEPEPETEAKPEKAKTTKKKRTK